MIKVFHNPAQLVTVDSNKKGFKRGSDLKNISVVENHSVVVEDGIIKDLIPSYKVNNSEFKVIDIKNKVLLPGFIDCHTHTVFAGSRANEFCEKLKGVHYEEIAKKGGGINTTVTSVRNSTEDELFNLIKPRIEHFISQGVTTLEIKSGYGLDFENEIKILSVINRLNNHFPIDIIPTFLGAHTFPKEYKNDRAGYIKLIIEKMIPHITKNKLAVFCDAFCESTAFLPEEVVLIFSAAKKSGMKIKLHSEQFNSIGGLDVGIRYNAKSIDHLEVIKDTDIQKFSNSDTVAVLLPGVSFFLDYGFAPARKLIDNEAIVAISTDYNPGSSNIANINLIMSIAALKMKMTIEETISAFTINAAKALDIETKTGSIEIGKQADFAILNTNNYSDLVYNIGINLNFMTVKNGEVIYKTKD